MASFNKLLNVEAWTVEYVVVWLKGVSSYSHNFARAFEDANISGKKLAVLDQSELEEILQDQNANLNHQLTIYKSIQNLLQMRHELNKETLHTLIILAISRLKAILNYLIALETCSCALTNDCSRCLKYKRYDIVSAGTSLALVYRKVISWLVRFPFTRLKTFENFREEINNEMKNLLRLFRKQCRYQNIKYSANNYYKEMKLKVTSILECCTKMLDYCDQNSDKDNGKISVINTCCYLEKVTIRRKSPGQILGLKLTSLSDGIFTIAEIVRESAADECSHLNVEDDIIAINKNIVVGWSSDNIIKLLEYAFSADTFSLVLRKMPKDHVISIKQQKNYMGQRLNAVKEMDLNSGLKEEITNNNFIQQRNHSFSDILDLSEEFIMEDSSDEEEEDYTNFDRSKLDSGSNQASTENLARSSTGRKFSIGRLYEKSSNGTGSKEKKLASQKNEKLAKKLNKNRLIRSMQNLLSFDRSRSTSVDNSGSANDEDDTQVKRKKSIEDSSSIRSDLFKSLFANKRWDFVSNNSNKNSFESLDSPSTPSLIGVRKIDSIKRANSKTSNNSNSSINECGLNGNSNNSKHIKSDEQTNCSLGIVKTVSRKPPIDKNKETYKMKTKKPSMQGWLYKKKPSSTTASSSTPNATSSPNSVQHINRSGGKWKKYWCVLTKDYITFYKNPDEKVPKDFLLLKDFAISKEIVSSKSKCGLVLVDKIKQITHQFYTDQGEDELNEWFQALNELYAKLVGGGESATSISTTSLSSGYETNQSNTQLAQDTSQSLPTSSTFSRKNNLQLHLSTIIDDDSLNNSLQKGATGAKNNQLVSPAMSPTLIAMYNNSSRESSPDFSNNNSKVASRDSSPGLNYSFQHEQETSESDAEIYSMTLCPEKQDLYKDIVAKNLNRKLSNAKNLSSGSLTSAILSASDISPSNGSFRKQMSCSPSSNTKFVYDYQDNRQDTSNETNKLQTEQSQYHQRANSLPGSLQACVGSYMNPKSQYKPAASETQTSIDSIDSSNKPNLGSTPETNIPVQWEYNRANSNSGTESDTTKNESASTNEPCQSPASTENANKNQTLQNLLLQFQKNSLLPKLMKRKIDSTNKMPLLNQIPAPSSVLISQNSENSPISSPNSPTVSLNVSHVQKPPHYNPYFQRQQSLQSPLTPPISTPTKQKPTTHQIKVQVGPSGITKINNFSFLTPDQMPFDQLGPVQSFFANNNLTLGRKYQAPIAVQTPGSASSSPVVYRTELTITPSSLNKKPSVQHPAQQTSQQNPQTLPFFNNSDISKRFQN